MVPGRGWRELWRRLLSRRQMEADIEDEIEFHIQGRTDVLVDGGLPEEEARRRARAEFGDVNRIRSDMARASGQLIRRRARRERGGDLVRDLRLAFRELRRSPGFATVAILTLTLGIGANTAMFSVLDGVVLRPLPFSEPERLVAVWPGMNFNVTLVDSLASKTPSLDGVAGVSYWSLTLTGDGPPESLDAGVVSTNFFQVLGVSPFLGRGFRPEERQPEGSDVVVLSYGFWMRRFGGDRDVVGRRIRLEGYDKESRQVIGVAPPGFQPPDRRADVWIPLHLARGHTLATDSTWYVNQVVARLGPGLPIGQASADVARAAREIHQEFPDRILEDLVRQARVTPLMASVLGDTATLLWSLLGAVGLVLIMACANLANLLLARGAARSRDAAIRRALGATPGRLVRQHLTAAGVLAVLGAGAGLILARVSLGLLLPGLERTQIPRAGEVALSPGVLAFTAGTAVLAALAFGLLPALRAGSEGLRSRMDSGGRGRTADARIHGINRALVAVETALAMVLVTGAGLMLRSVWHLYHVDPGFRSEGVVAVQISPSDARYRSEGEISRAFVAQVLDGVRSIPGVRDVGGIHLLPLTMGNWSFPYLAQDHPPPEDAPLPSANFRIVTPGYFRTMGIPVLRGRPFSETDGPEDAPVGLINETMARILWPGQDPVGKEILLFGNQPFEVVGVVGDVRQHGLERDPLPEMYRPFKQYSWPGLTLMVRGAGGAAALAPALRQAVWNADPNVPVPSIQDLSTVLHDSLARPRLFAQLLGAFGVLALLLGAVGIYGVMSYVVGARLPEMGVRVAMGADPRRLLRHALSMGMIPVVVGLAVGAAAALFATRLLRAGLYGVGATDPATFLGVLLVLAAAALAASWGPARRASRVDAMEILRKEG